MPRALPFLYATEELYDALSDRLAPILAKAELTATQFNVLYMVIEQGSMRMSDLAAHQRCVKSNISYVTRAMQREGLIALLPSQDDQRVRVISATKLGRQRYAIAKAASHKLEQALARAFGENATERLAQACLEAAAALDAL